MYTRGMRALGLLWAFLLCCVFAACQVSSQGDVPAPPPPPSATEGVPLKTVTPGKSRFLTAAGTAGTYTVPAGAYITSFSCHASGAGATLVITANGPGITIPEAGASIVIPPSGAYGLDATVLTPLTLGAGSTLVFTGTDAYAVTLYQAS